MKKNIVLTALSVAMLTACGGSSSSNNLPVFPQSALLIETAEDTVLSQTVSASDQDGDVITYSLASAATNGKVTINSSSGELSYAPNPDFNGQDSFSIAAADATGNTTQKITVNVTAVNDAPVIAIDNVLLSGGEVKQGAVSANDADNDTLTYSIQTPPSNGALTIDSATGAITYTVTNLEETQDSFVLGVSDGVADIVTKSITISASIASNIDRAYYYYASDKSRLQQAQAITDAQQDDQVKSTVYGSLASGYATAGFTNKVEALISPEAILDPQTRVNTLIDVARAYALLDDAQTAKSHLVTAQNLYNEILATNGIATLDAAIFIDIASVYDNLGDSQGQAQAYSLLELLMNTLPEGTQSQRLFFQYDRIVKAAVAKWQTTGDEVDRLFAKSLAERSMRLIPKIGYVTNRDGVTYSSITLIAYEYLITQWHQLNEVDLAKTTLARALALYGYVDYDADYSVAADQYAENTRNEFIWTSPDFAALFIALYPETDSATLVDIAKGSTWFDFVKGNIIAEADDARMLALVAASTSDEQALALAKSVKKEDDLRQYFSDIIAFGSSSPGAAVRLIEQKRYSAAKLILDEGLALVQSDEYFAENKASYSFVSGDSGCNRIASLYQNMANAAPDSDYLAQAKSAAKVCHDLVVTHYSTELVEDGVVQSSNLENTQAAAETAHLVASLNMADELRKMLDAAEKSLTQETDISSDNKISLLSQLGRELAQGGELLLAQGYYDRAIAEVAKVEEAASAAEVGNRTRYFYYNSRNTSSYTVLLEQIDAQQLTNDESATIKATAINKLSTLLEQVMTLLASRSDIIKNEEYPNFAALFVNIGLFDRAAEISKDIALGDVERASIEVNIARRLAIKDDFPSTNIASVDTDGDGMPNFFAPFATDEMIAASGLVLDADSDNDNVTDTDDAFPLDASRQ